LSPSLVCQQDGIACSLPVRIVTSDNVKGRSVYSRAAAAGALICKLCITKFNGQLLSVQCKVSNYCTVQPLSAILVISLEGEYA